MLRKLLDYKGYFFIESLVSLSVLTTIIGGYLSVNSFLIGKTAACEERLAMKRILYEEMTDYEHYGGPSIRNVLRGDKVYWVTISEKNSQVISVTVKNGKEAFTIEIQ